MKKKIYYLSTCSTCQKIIRELGIGKDFEQQDIKTEAITPAQLDEMAKMAGSYEALFSRRSMKYKELGLSEKTLSEQDYRKYILQHYTFLKRPVFIIGEKIFAGNARKTVEEIKKELS